jgi:hypothetical protein
LKRTVLLFTLVAALMFALAGVVLAQQTSTPEETMTPPASSSDAPDTPEKKIPDSYIVVLKDGEDPDPVVAKKKREIGDLKSNTFTRRP